MYGVKGKIVSAIIFNVSNFITDFASYNGLYEPGARHGRGQESRDAPILSESSIYLSSGALEASEMTFKHDQWYNLSCSRSVKAVRMQNLL